MNSPVAPIIAVAVRSLAGKEELRLAAIAELEERMAPQDGSSPDAVAEALAAFENADAQPRRGRWRMVLGLLTVLVSLPLLVGLAIQYLGGLAMIRGIGGMRPQSNGHKTLVERLGKDLSAAERLLLVGAPNTRKDADRWRPLWESAPDKPAYLAEYALASLRTHHCLSPEILEAATQIDPDNGWFLALDAAGKADGVVKKGTRTSKEKRDGKAIEWQVLDEPQLREALVQLHAATAKPRFAGYRSELHRERVRLLPPQDDLLSHVVWGAYVRGGDNGLVQFRYLGEALAAGAGLCAERQDREGFQQLVTDWRWLARAGVNEGDTLIDQLVARMLVTAPLASFRDAARALGLEAEAAKFAAEEQRERTEREEQSQDRLSQAGDSLIPERGSILSNSLALTTSIVKAAPVLTESDLRPGRLADHAVFDRVSAVVTWLGLGLGVAGVGWLFRGRPVIRTLAVRMLDLLRPADWGWILLGGVVAPVAWYLAITRLTPLSAREWSLLGSSGFLLPIFQKAALMFLLASLPLVVAGWRLGQRGAAFGLAGRHQRLGWLAVGAAAAAIPVLGAVMGLRVLPEWMFQALAAILLGLPCCWLLGVMFAYTAGAKTQELRRTTVGRMAVPAWLCGMVGCALALPLHHAEERYWFRQDQLLAIPADTPALSRYEARLVPLLRAETLERMAKLEISGGK